MTLDAVSDTGKIALSADWVELAALLSARQSASSADLVRSRAPLDEDEHARVVIDPDGSEVLEEEILENISELWVSDVREEIATRAQALGESYPFSIITSGQAWRLAASIEHQRHDHLLYVCCLLITARRYSLISGTIAEMDKVQQVIAYLIAGRVVQGEAYWFGYPRPDKTTTMKAAVEQLLTRMGFDAPQVVPPVWSTGTENDGGIDVVAWKNFGDKLSSRLVLYGQVASGKNWEGKSVIEDASSTFPHWVRDYGQRHYVPAMFIPWPQYIGVEPTRDRSFRQRVTEACIKNEKLYGLTIDRGRIAELARLSVITGNNDEPGLVAYLEQWRSQVIETLTA